MAELGSAVTADPSTDAHSANSSADQPSRVIAAVSCDEADNVSDTSAATYTEADATSEEVAELLYELANVLIANLPDLIGLLSGSRRGFANAAVTKQNGRLSFSLSQEGSPFWVDLTANWGTSDTSETGLCIWCNGASLEGQRDASDRWQFQADFISRNDDVARSSGTGWMVGPYFVAKAPGSALFF